MTRIHRALISLALTASMAGCASASTVNAAGPSTVAGPTGSAGPTSAGASTPAGPTCGNHVVADESANGTTVCVALGSELTVLLHSTAGSTWSEPQVAGTAVGAGTGVPTPHDAVGWSFPARVAGTAEISSSRPDCPQTGAVACRARLAFELRVEVR